MSLNRIYISVLIVLLFCNFPLFSQDTAVTNPENPSTEDSSKKTDVVNPKEAEASLKPKHDKLHEKIPIDFGVFLDGYYNMNMNYPTATSQNYTTQAVQNNSFAINLAHVEGKLDTEKFRGRLAFQYGTSVNNNYANETTNQKYSNQFSVRNIQEAYVGVKLGKKTWLDGGIYFGNIGFESWISGYNWVYTRALVLDNVPYYSTGLRLTHELTDKLAIQFHLMNGWQNITDNNKDKAVGFQMVYKITDKMKFTYNNFIGNETSSPATTDSTGTVYMPAKVHVNDYVNYSPYTRNTRYYHNFIYHYDVTDRFGIAGSFDVGYQIRGTRDVYNPFIPSDYNSSHPYYKSHSNSFRQWYDGTLWIMYKFADEWRIAGRVERYVDRENANVPIVKQSSEFTKYPGRRPNGFQVSGISLNFDYMPNEYAMLRTEFKYMKSMDPIYDYQNSSDLSRHEKKIVFAMSLRY